MPLKALSFWRFLAVEHLVFDEGKIFREAIFRSLKEKRTVVGKDILGALRVKERQNTTCKRSRSGTNLENAKDSTLGQCFDDLCESIFDLLVDDREVSTFAVETLHHRGGATWKKNFQRIGFTTENSAKVWTGGTLQLRLRSELRHFLSKLIEEGNGVLILGYFGNRPFVVSGFFQKATFGQGRELSDNKLVVMICNRKFGSKRLHRQGATYLRLPAQLEVAIDNELTGNLVERREKGSVVISESAFLIQRGEIRICRSNQLFRRRQVCASFLAGALETDWLPQSLIKTFLHLITIALLDSVRAEPVDLGDKVTSVIIDIDVGDDILAIVIRVHLGVPP